jgi:VWFA-related protein
MKFKAMRPLWSGALTTFLVLSLLPSSSFLFSSLAGTGQNEKSRANGSSRIGLFDSAIREASDRSGLIARATAFDSEQNQSSAQDQQSDSGAPKKRKAPPFDRPPLNPNQKPNDSTGQTGDRTQDGSSTGGNNRTSSGTSTNNSSTRDNGRQPVLKRPEDSRDSSSADAQDDTDRGRNKPPVLRRSSDYDPSQPQDSRQNRKRQNGPDDQDPNSGQQSQDEDVIRLESTLVNIPLLVSDRNGRYIPQLTKRDFLLWEDGTPQEIASFGSEEVPINIALLLDVSPSVAGSIDDIQDAALAFVRELRAQDKVMVVSFDRNAHFLTDFTSDRRQLEWAIRSTKTGSGTSIYDTVVETVSNRLRGIEGRRALILFSDGEDTTSRRATYDEAVNVVVESDVLVYGLRYPGTGFIAGGGGGWPRSRYPGIQLPFPFPFPWPQQRRFPGPQSPRGQGPTGFGRDFMADITNAGGGPVYDAQSIRDLTNLASRVAEELRHVYVLSYYPTNPLSNGGYRTIRIKVRNRDDIAVRHRRGYSASGRPTTADSRH